MKLNYLAEIQDRELENEYFHFEMERSRKYLSSLLLGFAVLFTLFIITDYLMIHDPTLLSEAIFKRMLVVGSILVFALGIRFLKCDWQMTYWITAFELIFVGLYSYMMLPGCIAPYYFKCIDTLLIIVCIYLVPNKWIHVIFAAFAFSVTWLALVPTLYPHITALDYYLGMLYIGIVLVLGAVCVFRINLYRRQHYVDNRQLKARAETDGLTGVYNRAKFDSELKKGIARFQREGVPYCVILFDFDNFKYFNDRYGHISGDKMIIETTGLVRSGVREGDLISRWGGDEFAILLPNTTKQQAAEIADDLRKSIVEHDFGMDRQLSCSFGVTQIKEYHTVETAIAEADQLLYQAKSAGKNLVTY